MKRNSLNHLGNTGIPKPMEVRQGPLNFHFMLFYKFKPCFLIIFICKIKFWSKTFSLFFPHSKYMGARLLRILFYELRFFGPELFVKKRVHCSMKKK